MILFFLPNIFSREVTENISVSLTKMLHIVTCIRDYRRGLDWMTVFINTLYNQLLLTNNTALSLIYSLPLHTHYISQSSLVISWQRN
jgi:hypothetical protein